MAKKHKWMPDATTVEFTKAELLKRLAVVDQDKKAKSRVLKMETEFRKKIKTHVDSLPAKDSKFAKFHTSPFVVLFYSMQHGFSHIYEVEQAILPAKVFSSMETSAGRMVEAVALPVYGWQVVLSEMHSANSALDGKKLSGETLCLATLKSGPRCLNDEMSENFADTILNNCQAWADEAGVSKIDFTYGVLYGTQRKSNKKDWHILRNIAEKMPKSIQIHPDHRWHCVFENGGVEVNVTVRIGIDLWNYIGGSQNTLTELASALIRACIAPSDVEPEEYVFTISDLREIISLDSVPEDFNVALLQRSQLEWLFFFARHFCDRLTDGNPAL